jgi:hypothetical protein
VGYAVPSAVRPAKIHADDWRTVRVRPGYVVSGRGRIVRPAEVKNEKHRKRAILAGNLLGKTDRGKPTITCDLAHVLFHSLPALGMAAAKAAVCQPGRRYPRWLG